MLNSTEAEVGFNDPVGLPLARVPGIDAYEPRGFDVWDTQLMREICGERLHKAIQSLLISHSQLAGMNLSESGKADCFDSLMDELKALRESVKDEFNDL